MRCVLAGVHIIGFVDSTISRVDPLMRRVVCDIDAIVGAKSQGSPKTEALYLVDELDDSVQSARISAPSSQSSFGSILLWCSETKKFATLCQKLHRNSTLRWVWAAL